ncbi:hypothetical protein PT015_19865 [Candidatus Mycobacterium wuenschmannii]|uniref:Uncharacterized protein n=1 Tax=Candidatus Mycobacterium wuenschmannii TaxID=3027808 RepID=A0ABY8VVR3_9MYCO|nr:hypothetical protein [Candidatus Mycobacterium wuenschmannii]WIM87100.1 hypothetical protein PT015_19865 [Candidatus Mycobacterium wuenschmannii]
MTKLLESLLRYLGVLYLSPSYRMTDSTTTGSADENASLRLTGDAVSWRLTNDRGQIRLVIAPTKLESAENWFRLTSVRQYLDGIEERGTMLDDELASWLNGNVERIEALFSSESVAVESCGALITLEEAKATKLFGPEHNS